MLIKKIKKGRWYRTEMGIGECLATGGTFPPTVRMNITHPFPRGVVFVKPRDVIEEVEAPEEQMRKAHAEATRRDTIAPVSPVAEASFREAKEIMAKATPKVDPEVLEVAYATAQANDHGFGATARGIAEHAVYLAARKQVVTKENVAKIVLDALHAELEG